MLGTPYSIKKIAELALARDLFQGVVNPTKLRYLSFDSRTISHGAQTLFVAINGPGRDGHDFVDDAYQKGVRNFIVEKPLSGLEGVCYALVDDSLNALQTLAMFHRQQFDYPVVGITGSNGKTIVKEWLATLVELDHQLVKSPMSYNSQLGVPVSVLQMNPVADLALIEAGISQVDEMAVLAGIIQPDWGILTHMGPAHADGFESFTQKLREKCQLFEGCSKVLVSGDQPEITELLLEWEIPVVTARDYDLPEINFHDAADRENATLAAMAALELGLPKEEVEERLPLLLPVQMRRELITDNPEVTIINDSYNSDPDSVRIALRSLADIKTHSEKRIILSDVPHLGDRQLQVQSQLLTIAEEIAGKDGVWTVGPIYLKMRKKQAFATTRDLLDALPYDHFKNTAVLLKGARAFQLESVIPLLAPKLNATWFRIDLDALAENFHLLRKGLPSQTRTMAMLKAYGYGSGSWEIAQALAMAGVDYLAVAYTSEGVDLRQSGIELPIMVMNPDPGAMESLLDFDLQPQISSLQQLDRYLRSARLTGGGSWPVHLKVETGMGRLGFTQEDLQPLVKNLMAHPELEVVSLLSHLAAADDPDEDAFTHDQARRFLSFWENLREQCGIAPWRHLLNTAGLIRFPQYAFEMVRMGIGLYGISPLNRRDRDLQIANSESLDHLREIGSMISSITQIHTYPKGTSIGYGRAQFTERESRIATVPVGYADGLPRSLGLGTAKFFVRGKEAPTFGRICMDMLMLDVTDIPEAQDGDDVLLFGHWEESYLPVRRVADWADTIPYEILVRISPRVRRVYIRN